MKWRWEYLTVSEFEKAREKAERVAMIPVGSLETRGSHLPPGNDGLKIEKIANMVDHAEPVVALPTLFYTESYQAKLYPGALCIHSELLTAPLENICDEAYRNGFDKIVLLHGHGGNTPPEETQDIGHACEMETSIALYLIPEAVNMNAIMG